MRKTKKMLEEEVALITTEKDELQKKYNNLVSQLETLLKQKKVVNLRPEIVMKHTLSTLDRLMFWRSVNIPPPNVCIMADDIHLAGMTLGNLNCHSGVVHIKDRINIKDGINLQ